VFIWDVQTLAIVYMTFVVFMGSFGFLLWLCVYGYVYGCVWGYVYGVMCMDTGSRSSARPGSINIGAYLSLEPVSIIIGTYSLLEARFYHHWDLLASRGPFE
jgi:NhaP-type Na+/H+ or K+/H+ antiporter